MSARKISVGLAILFVIFAVRIALGEALGWEIDYPSVAYGAIFSFVYCCWSNWRPS